MVMNPPFILCERVQSVAILRLNRPEKRNALSREMIEELSENFKQLKEDEQLRAVILTAGGEVVFCSGTDITELAKLSEAEAIGVSASGQKLCEQIEAFPVPVIAAVNGIAAGGGWELALACHLRIASSEATFSLPETKIGVISAYGGTQRLAREAGSGRALEIMLTGKTITADEALAMGLVNRVVNAAGLLAEANSVAREIARLAPLAIRACLKAVTLGLQLSLEDGLALETELFSSLFATDDVREGTRAFLEKRSPVFSGK
jgi:enoyl-CoA hydratase